MVKHKQVLVFFHYQTSKPLTDICVKGQQGYFLLDTGIYNSSLHSVLVVETKAHRNSRALFKSKQRKSATADSFCTFDVLRLAFFCDAP